MEDVEALERVVEERRLHRLRFLLRVGGKVEVWTLHALHFDGGASGSQIFPANDMRFADLYFVLFFTAHSWSGILRWHGWVYRGQS